MVCVLFIMWCSTKNTSVQSWVLHSCNTKQDQGNNCINESLTISVPGVSQVLRIPGADQLSPQNDKLSQEIWSLGHNSRENPSALTDLDCNCNNEEAKASQKKSFFWFKSDFLKQKTCLIIFALLDKVELTEDGKLYRQCFHESPDSAADFQRADPHGDMAMGLWHSSNESRDCCLLILMASSRDLHLSFSDVIHSWSMEIDVFHREGNATWLGWASNVHAVFLGLGKLSCNGKTHSSNAMMLKRQWGEGSNGEI